MSEMSFYMLEDSAKNIKHVTEKTIVGDPLTLDEILPAMEEFLRGCGFHFDGRLEFTPD